MAKSIDERVVSLKFDNAQFKRAASETIGILENLKSKLNFKGFTGGLKDATADIHSISKATQQVDMGQLTSEVSNAGRQFNVLGTVATGALLKIGATVTETAAKMTDALFFRGARDGFAEYEMQMGSIQTIMANTARHGTTMQQVNATLDDLNQYADKTIYNFAEMTRNIGTFTAAGVELDTSAKAIKGIANVAAMSGSTSQQASTAMYQLSQAIAAGSVKLMDWNSVVNAGMGGQAFQEALWDSAKAMGKLTEKSGAGYESFQQWIDAGNSFRESLSEEWITADVLTSTLENFTGELSKADLMAKGFSEERANYIFEMSKRAESAATEVKTLTQLFDTMGEAIGSGWAQTWGILVGDFEEAKKLFSGINSVVEPFINGMSDSRNAILAQWKAGKGRDAVIDGMIAQFKYLGQIIETITGSFRKFFKAIDAPWLNEVTHQWKLWSLSLKLSEENAANLGQVFDGIFSILRLNFEIIKGGIGLVGRLFGTVTKSSGGVLAAAAAFGKLLSSVSEFILNSKAIPAVFDAIYLAIKPVIGIIGLIVQAFGNLVKMVSGPVLWALPKLGELIAKAFEKVANAVERVKQVVTKGLAEPMNNAFQSLGNNLKRVQGYLEAFYKNNLSDTINSFGSAVKRQSRAVAKTLETWGESAKDLATTGWDKFTGQIKQFGRTIKSSDANIRGFFSWFDPKGLNETLGITRRLDSAFQSLRSTLSGIKMPDFSALKFSMPDFSSMGSNLKTMSSSVSSSMGNAFASVKMGSVSGTFENIKKSIADLVGYIRNIDVGSILKSIGSGISNFASSSFSSLKELGSSLKNALTSIDWSNVGRTAAELLIKGITGAAVAVGSIAKWITDTLVSAIQSIDWAAIWGNIKDFGMVFRDVSSEMTQAFQGKELEAPQIVTIFGESNADKITKGLQSVGNAFQSTGGKIRAFSSEVKKGDALQGIREMVGDSWVDTNDAVASVAADLVNTFKKAFDSLTTIGAFIKNPFTDMATKFKTSAKSELDGIGTALQTNFQSMLETAADVDVSRVMNAFGVSLFGAAALQFSSFGKTIASPMKSISTAIDSLAKSGVGVLDAVKDSIKGFQKVMMVEAQSNAILKVAIAIAAMAASIYFLGQMDPDALWRGVAALGAMMAALAALMAIIAALAKSLAKTEGATKSLSSIGLAMIGLAIAMGIMTYSVEKLSGMDFKSLAQGVGAVVAIIAALVVAVRLMPEKDLLKASVAIFTLASSMGMMAGAVEKMGNLQPEQIKQGLITMAGAMGILVLTTRLINPANIMGVSTSLSLLAIGLGLMAISLRMFEDIDMQGLWNAALTLGVIMGIMTAFTLVIDPSRIMAISVSFGILAVSMMLMLHAIKAFAEVDTGTLSKGIFGVAAAVGAIGFAMRAFPQSTMDKIGIEMAMLAGAMLVMGSAVEKMGSLDVLTLAKGIGGIAISIAAIGIALQTMSMGGGGMAKAAIGLTLIAGGLYILAGAIQRFESIDTGTMVKALVTLGVALGGLAAMALVANAALPAFLAVIAAIAVIATTLYVMAAAFQVMAQVPLAAVITLMVAFAAALGLVVAAAYLIMPAIPGVIALAAALIAIGAAALLFGAGVALIGAGVLMLANAIQLISQLGPQALESAQILGEAISMLITTMAVGLMAGIPIIVQAILAVLTAILTAIDDFLAVSGPTIVSILGRLIQMLADALIQNVPVILQALQVALLAVLDFVVTMVPIIVESFLNLIESIINTLAEGIPRVVEAVINLYQALVDTIATQGPRLISITLNGILQLGVNVVGAITGLGPGWATAFKNSAIHAVQGFINGINQKLQDALNTIKDFGSKVNAKFKEVLSIHSPSRVFKSHGQNVVEGFVIGVNDNADSGVDAVGGFANAVIGVAESIFGSGRVRSVMQRFGINVSNGVRTGMQAPQGILLESLNGMIAIVQGKTPEFSDASKAFFDSFAKGMGNSKFNQRLDQLTKHAEAERATLIKEKKLEQMKEEDAAKERREKVYQDVEDAKKALAEAEEDKANAVADANAREADTRQQAAQASKDQRDAEQERKQAAADATRARRDAEQKEKSISDARKKLEKAERERELYEYEMYGEEAGVAFVDGIAVGLIKKEDEIPTLAESITNVLWDELDKGKKKVDDYLDAFTALRSIDGIFSGLSTNLRNFRRALTRASNATNDKSLYRNLGQAADALLGVAGALSEVLEVLEKIKPLVPLLLNELEKQLPAIIQFVAPFAPQLAATLGGGLTAAIPAIVGPAVAIAGGVITALALMYDFGSQQRLKNFVDNIVMAITSLIANLPNRLADFVEVLANGLIWFAEYGPDWIVDTIMQVINAVIEFLVTSPDAVARIVTAVLDAVIALITVFPFKLLDAILRLISELFLAVVENLPLIVINLVAAFFKIGVTLAAKIIEGLGNLITGLVEFFVLLPGKVAATVIAAVYSIANTFTQAIPNAFRNAIDEAYNIGYNVIMGFKRGILNTWDLVKDAVARPFQAVIDIVKKVFGIRSPSREFMSIGRYLMQGFATGIDKNITTVDKSMDSFQNTVSTAVDELMRDIEAFGDSQMVFRPDLDLSQASRQLADFNRSVDTSLTTSLAGGISTDGGATAGTVNNVVFNQTNTSPKPLSAIEIYRNTDRLLEAVR